MSVHPGPEASADAATRDQQPRARHTPGPWSVRNEFSQDHGQFCVDGPDNIEIAMVVAWYADHRAESEANAALIAAAPELLEALQEWAEGHRLHGCLRGETRAKMHAAIAKATDQ